MQEIEFTISTVEIAEMLDNTPHKDILKKLEGRTQKNGKHIKGYIEILNEHQMVPVDFFIPSTYRDSSGKENKCYKVTKKGCEFLANKFNGEKGVLFTARYINRFHEMQDMITGKAAGQEPEIPWFMKKLDEYGYIMLFRDFETITGISLDWDMPFWKAHHEVMNSRPPLLWNGWHWHTRVNKEEFREKYGFDYGDGKCMKYFYPCGVRKALQLCKEDKKLKLEQSAYEMITEGLKVIQPHKKKELEQNKTDIQIIARKEQKDRSSDKPIKISITIGNEIITEIR